MTKRRIGVLSALVLAGWLVPASALAQATFGVGVQAEVTAEAPPPPTAVVTAEVTPPPPPPAATPPPPVVVVQPAPQQDLALELEAAERLRFAGVLTFSLGTSSVGVGCVLMLVGAFGVGFSAVSLNPEGAGAWGALYVTGAVLALAGTAATIASIPMWIIGAVRSARIRVQMARLAPGLAFVPTDGGGYASLGFRF